MPLVRSMSSVWSGVSLYAYTYGTLKLSPGGLNMALVWISVEPAEAAFGALRRINANIGRLFLAEA